MTPPERHAQRASDLRQMAWLFLVSYGIVSGLALLAVYLP